MAACGASTFMLVLDWKKRIRENKKVKATRNSPCGVEVKAKCRKSK